MTTLFFLLIHLSTLAGIFPGCRGPMLPVYERSNTSYSRIIEKKSQESVALDTTSECQTLYGLGYEYNKNNLYQQGFDTIKRYVVTCPEHYAIAHAFPMLTNCAHNLGSDIPSGRAFRADYLVWLKSVLYLNTTNHEYFCACVLAMEGALPLPNDTTPGAGSRTINIGLAVDQWLLQHTSCDSPWLWQEYMGSRKTQYEQWANDPFAYKLDTTLPSMHDLGLDSLLNVHLKLGVHQGQDRFASIVPTYAITSNPFNRETSLRLTLHDPAYVRTEIFDLLGNVVGGTDDSRTLDPGEHTIPITIGTNPSGTYFLRILLGTGEVRTIKLSKE